MMKNRMFLALATLVGIIAWAAAPQRSMLQEMRQNGDEPSQTFIVTNTDPSGAGSLSQAITSANANPGLDTINFNVPGSGIQFFFTMATLPAVTDPVVIDGTTQPGYAGTPLIHIEGLGISRSLDVTGSGTTVKGMSFTSNSAGASSGIVRLAGTGNHVVTGCSFGVRGDSTRPTTSSAGLLIESNGNRVGGTTAAERNYFAVTNEHQLVIQNGASNNRVTGNWFGTAPNGTRLVTNGRDAIRILNSPNNTIGGSTGTTPGGACTGECNVIAGAGNNGIFINGAAATGNRVIGNFVGLFAAGNNVNPNNLGVRIENAPGNIVGGTTAAERNVITGNSGLYGVMVTAAGSTGNVITGNYIGLYTNGTSAPTPAFATLDGILLNAQSSGTRIGGTTAGERNVISGLSGNGIEIAASNGNIVEGNYIGTDATGMARSTTLSNGISIQFSDNNVIGGTQGTTLGGACTGACNVISGNGNNGTGDGITLNTANGNTIDGNYIGLRADGLAALLNGITPNGATFNGKAVRLVTSNNNTIGRPLPIPQAQAGSEMCTPANSCIIQDDRTSNFMTINNTTGIATFTDCLNGATYDLNNITIPISLDVFLSVPRGYAPDDPFQRRLYGEAAFKTFQPGDSFRFTEPNNPLGGSLIHFYRFYADREEINRYGGECDDFGLQLFTGQIGISQSVSNLVYFLNSGVTRDLRDPIFDLPAYTALFVENSDDTNIIAPRIFGTGAAPLISIDIEPTQRISFKHPELLRHEFPDLSSSPILNADRPFVQSPADPLKVRFPNINVGVIDGRVVFEPNAQVQFEVFGSEYIRGVDGSLIENVQPLFRFDEQSDAQGNVDIQEPVPVADSNSIRGFRNLRLTVSKVVPARGEAGQETIQYTTEMSPPIVIPHAPFNWDRDGKTDIAVYRPGVHTWYRLNSGDNSFNATQFGTADDTLVTGDYTGDGVQDLAVFRPSNATWYIAHVGGTPAANFDAIPWGTPTDVPVTGDFDGDGRQDVGVFRPSNGTWYIRSTIADGLVARQWGLSSDKPVPADYDGDGQTDIAVYRNGTWYISPCAACALRAEQFGLAGDIPVPADYDRDGKADIAVFRPSTGIWYVNGSAAGFTAHQWGVSTDIPVNGDFDADGRNDIAVWRPSTGTWWILKSGNGQFAAFQWGQNGDIPVPRF